MLLNWRKENNCPLYFVQNFSEFPPWEICVYIFSWDSLPHPIYFMSNLSKRYILLLLPESIWAIVVTRHRSCVYRKTTSFQYPVVYSLVFPKNILTYFFLFLYKGKQLDNKIEILVSKWNVGFRPLLHIHISNLRQ